MAGIGAIIATVAQAAGATETTDPAAAFEQLLNQLAQGDSTNPTSMADTAGGARGGADLLQMVMTGVGLFGLM